MFTRRQKMEQKRGVVIVPGEKISFFLSPISLLKGCIKTMAFLVGSPNSSSCVPPPPPPPNLLTTTPKQQSDVHAPFFLVGQGGRHGHPWLVSTIVDRHGNQAIRSQMGVYQGASYGKKQNSSHPFVQEKTSA